MFSVVRQMRALSFFMEMFRSKFTVFLLVLLFLDLFLITCNATGRCLQAENSSLLQLKKGFTTGKLDSWKPGTDCCSWKGVTCNEFGRVIGLDLSFRFITGAINPCLFNLTSLDTLSFSGNNFNRIPIPDSGWEKLVNLSRLNLSNAEFAGKVPASISCLKKLTSLDLSCRFYPGSLAINPMILQNMSSLKDLVLDFVNVSSYRDEWCGVLVNATHVLELLSMRGCSLFGPICSSLPMLHFLSVIDFGENNLDFNIPNSFSNFSSLSKLQLDGNNFKGYFPYQIFQLRNLKYLDISHNPMLSGYLPYFSKYSNLKSLSVTNTNFSGNLPNSIGNLKFLIDLELSNCQFNGTMPSYIVSLSELANLDLSHNNFNGVVGLEFIKDLKNLTRLDMSNSGFSLSQHHENIGSSSSSFPKMQILLLVSCNLTKIPTFLKYQDHMKCLDLSKNRIHGKIPSWLWRIGDIKQFKCFIPSATTKSTLIFLFLADNNLTGKIPPFIPSTSIVSQLTYLSLANNNLNGKIPPFTCNLSLVMLDLSNNKLFGTIPPCLLEGIDLLLLNLGGNRLHGAIPHAFNPKCTLLTLNLRDNQLEGLLPRSLSNCMPLEILDLGNNNLKNTFPYWLGNMSSLTILDLRSNKFYGLIEPPDARHETNYAFPKMYVFDISSNNFSGNLPAKCLNHFKSMMKNDILRFNDFYFLNEEIYLYALTIMNKARLMTLQKYIAISIDFSNNHFEGDIPSVFGQLVSLQVINMSRNYLTGEIPPELGNLVQLESLDLSRNYLSGKIPKEFVSLHFLSDLNLSYNKLVGTVPQGGQLCSFAYTSFEGNVGLQWFSCNTSVQTKNNTTTSPPSLGGTSPNNKSYMIVLGILFGVGFGVSVAIVLVLDVIFCKKSRRKSKRPNNG